MTPVVIGAVATETPAGESDNVWPRASPTDEAREPLKNTFIKRATLIREGGKKKRRRIKHVTETEDTGLSELSTRRRANNSCSRKSEGSYGVEFVSSGKVSSSLCLSAPLPFFSLAGDTQSALRCSPRAHRAHRGEIRSAHPLILITANTVNANGVSESAPSPAALLQCAGSLYSPRLVRRVSAESAG